NRSEGTVSVFTVAGNKLTPAGKIQLGDSKSGPSHVAFTPDGKSALVTRDGDNRVSILTIDGSKVEDSKAFMVGGVRPYRLEIGPKGDVAVFRNQGGGQGDIDVINVIDLKAKPPRIVDTISVGQTPEGIGMSSDGKYVAVSVMNGSNRPKDHPAFNDFGLPTSIFGQRYDAEKGCADQGRTLVSRRGLQQEQQDRRDSMHG